MNVPLKTFEKLILDNSVKWSSKKGRDLGVRIIEIDGDLMRNVIADDKFAEFWKSIKAQLPKDFCVMDLGAPFSGVAPLISASGMYREGFAVFAGSATWEKVERLGSIPILDIKVDNFYRRRNIAGGYGDPNNPDLLKVDFSGIQDEQGGQ